MQVEEMELFLSKSYKYEALGEFVFVYNCELSSSGPSQGCKGQSQVKSSSEMDLFLAADQQVLMSVCLSVCVCGQLVRMHAQCSRMFQNACRMF